MKKAVLTFFAFLMLFFATEAQATQHNYVKGHFRKGGTYVHSHYHRSPRITQPHYRKLPKPKIYKTRVKMPRRKSH